MSAFISEPTWPKLEAGYGFNSLRFEEIRYASGIRIHPHTHEQAFLDLCLQGSIQERWNRRTFTRGPFTLTFLPIGAPHAAYFPEEVRTFQIVLPALWLERVGQVAPLVDMLADYERGLPNWIAARLYREFRRRDNVTPLILEGMLMELIAEMSRHSVPLAENDRPRWLKQATDYLHAHFTETIAMEAIAAAVGVHPSHLMRGFRQHYRCTIGDYVRKLRVEYACHLLSTSNAAPSQIAYAVGFADQSHLNRTFKGCMGMTPAEFQKVCGHASRRQEVIP